MKIYKPSERTSIIRILSGRSNVFLLTSGNRKLIVDTGISLMWPLLVHRLNKLGIKSIDYLVLTHTHNDHAANAARLREKYNLRVMVHSSEAGYLNSGQNILPAGTNPATRFIIKFLGKVYLKYFKYPPCPHDYIINDFYDLKGFGFNACVIHTPGHTVGSVSVIVEDKIAIVGDTMFGISKKSVFPPYANDTVNMIRSWDKLLQTGCSIFIPSHGTADSRELVEASFNKRKNIIGL